MKTSATKHQKLSVFRFHFYGMMTNVKKLEREAEALEREIPGMDAIRIRLRTVHSHLTQLTESINLLDKKDKQ